MGLDTGDAGNEARDLGPSREDCKDPTVPNGAPVLTFPRLDPDEPKASRRYAIFRKRGVALGKSSGKTSTLILFVSTSVRNLDMGPTN